MPKPSSKPKAVIEKTLLATLPWTSTNFGQQAEIDAFMAASRTWETLATVHAVGGVDAEDVASFLVNAVNSWDELRCLLKKTSIALEKYQGGEALTPKDWRKNAVVLARTKEMIK